MPKTRKNMPRLAMMEARQIPGCGAAEIFTTPAPARSIRPSGMPALSLACGSQNRALPLLLDHNHRSVIPFQLHRCAIGFGTIPDIDLVP
jgi:hypothetical protein